MDKKISTAELEIMRLLWQTNRAMTIAELRDELMKTKDWKKTTIQTLVVRLRDKGIIELLDKYGAAQYVPCVTEDEYNLSEEKAVQERFGSPKALAIAMVRNGSLTDADILELREYFKMGGDAK